MADKQDEKDLTDIDIGYSSDPVMSSCGPNENEDIASSADCVSETTTCPFRKERNTKTRPCRNADFQGVLSKSSSPGLHSSNTFLCPPILPAFQSLRRFGGEKLREARQVVEKISMQVFEKDTVGRPETDTPGTSGCDLGIKLADSFKTTLVRAGHDIAATCQGALAKMKKFGVQVSVHQSVNGPDSDKSPPQQEQSDCESTTGGESRKAHLESFERGEKDLEAGPGLPSSVEREDNGNSTPSRAPAPPALSTDPCYSDEQMNVDYGRNDPETETGEQNRRHTTEESMAGCSPITLLAVAFGEQSASHQNGTGDRRTPSGNQGQQRGSAVGDDMCLNCLQNPHEESDKIALNRSLPLERRCYFCGDPVSVILEVSVPTKRFICGKQQCQDQGR